MKGGGSSCCVQSCQNSVGRRNKNVIFYSFPIGNSEQRMQWIKSINRKNPDGTYWEPSPHSVICSEHFVGGKKASSPDAEGFLPTLFPPPRPTPPPIHRPPIMRNPARNDDASSKEIAVVELDEGSSKGHPLGRIESNPQETYSNSSMTSERPLRKSARVPQKRSNWIETIDDEDVDDPEYGFQTDNNRSTMNNGSSNRGIKRPAAPVAPAPPAAPPAPPHHEYNDDDGATEAELVVAKMSLINSLISELTCTQCGDKSLSIKKSREDKRIVYGLKLHCRKCKVLKEVLSSTKVKVNLTSAERNLLERGRSNSHHNFHRCPICNKNFSDATALHIHKKTHNPTPAPPPVRTPVRTPIAKEPTSYFEGGVEEENETRIEPQGQNSVIRPRVPAKTASVTKSTSSLASLRVKQERSNLKEEPIDIVEEDIDDPLGVEGSSASHDSYFMDSVVTEEPNEA